MTDSISAAKMIATTVGDGRGTQPGIVNRPRSKRAARGAGRADGVGAAGVVEAGGIASGGGDSVAAGGRNHSGSSSGDGSILTGREPPTDSEPRRWRRPQTGTRCTATRRSPLARHQLQESRGGAEYP